MAAWPAAAAAQLRHDDVPAIKAVTCAACHGAAGNSRSATMPILAGMDPAYFKKQIQDYASGLRPSPEMEPYAKQAPGAGRRRHRGVLRPPDDGAHADPERRRRGVPRAGGGGRVRRLPWCRRQGDRGKLIPALAGQPPGYLRAHMLLLKRDQRNPKNEAPRAVKAP